MHSLFWLAGLQFPASAQHQRRVGCCSADSSMGQGQNSKFQVTFPLNTYHIYTSVLLDYPKSNHCNRIQDVMIDKLCQLEQFRQPSFKLQTVGDIPPQEKLKCSFRSSWKEAWLKDGEIKLGEIKPRSGRALSPNGKKGIVNHCSTFIYKVLQSEVMRHPFAQQPPTVEAYFSDWLCLCPAHVIIFQLQMLSPSPLFWFCSSK